MEKKLELRHLAAYLPYGLKMVLETKGNFENSPNNLNIITLTCNTMQTAFVEKRYRQISCKPLLIPLSNCQGPINIDGENTYFTSWVIKKTGFDVDSDLDFIIDVPHREDGTVYHSIFKSMAVFNLLLEYHFDVFNLIDSGLALNKLTTPH